MSSTNRTTKIKSLHKLLLKRYKHIPETPSRSVLEHLVYSALLENASYEQADGAFAVLENHYIDWNEVRVSTAAELAYTFPQLPNSLAAGERIRKTLQAVFETTYVFDLENLEKKNLSQAIEYLESLGVCSRFMIDYTIQNALGGHQIPLGELALRIFRLLDLAQVSKDKTKEDVSGLERAIVKNQGLQFSTLLHLMAIEFSTENDIDALRTLLKPIDAKVLKRDCAAPVLQVAKPAKQEKPKFVVPPIADVASALEEDLEIEVVSDVEEVEFIPNPITGEEVIMEEDDEYSDKPLKTVKKPKKPQKKNIQQKGEVSESTGVEKKSQTNSLEGVKKQELKGQKAEPKKHKNSDVKDVKSSKSASKKDRSQEEAKPSKPGKSAIRTLRQTKPK